MTVEYEKHGNAFGDVDPQDALSIIGSPARQRFSLSLCFHRSARLFFMLLYMLRFPLASYRSWWMSEAVQVRHSLYISIRILIYSSAVNLLEE